jgi:Cysteine dioxygenase type I
MASPSRRGDDRGPPLPSVVGDGVDFEAMIRDAAGPGACDRTAAGPERDRRPARTGRLGHGELIAMAEALAPSARRHPGMDRPVSRRWAAVASSPVFEAWVIAWPAGGSIELHDHGDTAGAVAVVAGSLVETTVAPASHGSFTTARHVVEAGRTTSFDGGHIHDLVNVGSEPALSVHVYAPRLRRMTYYRVVGDRLCPGRTVDHRLEDWSNSTDVRAIAG